MRSESGRLFAVAVVEVVIAACAAFSPGVRLSGLLILCPLLASRLLTARSTAVLGAVATCLVALRPDPGAVTPATALADQAVHIALMAAVGLWATAAAHARARSRTALTRVNHVAEVTQRALIRTLPTEIGELSLAAHTRSAASDTLLGGDFHDAVLLPTGPRLIIGDVKGHGLETICVGAAVLGAFRQYATEADLVRLAHTLDTRLRPELGDEDFVTVLLVDFTPTEVRLVNCGHPPPLRTGRRLDLLEPAAPSPPLGLAPTPSIQRIKLVPGQRLLLYTDGLTEARNPEGALLPLDHEVHAALAAPELDQALASLLDVVERHTGGDVKDDLTVVLAQPDPTPHAAPLDTERGRPAAEAPTADHSRMP